MKLMILAKHCIALIINNIRGGVRYNLLKKEYIQMANSSTLDCSTKRHSITTLN